MRVALLRRRFAALRAAVGRRRYVRVALARAAGKLQRRTVRTAAVILLHPSCALFVTEAIFEVARSAV